LARIIGDGPISGLRPASGRFNLNQSHSMKIPITALLLAAGLLATPVLADNPMVGGAPMSPHKNIVQNASKSADHTTLVAAVKAGGLVDTLESKGPFTVFAPTNEAFAALPAGTVDTLLKPENKDQLVKILTYHVVPGKMTFHKLKSLIDAGSGQATLKTVQGEDLTVMLNGTSDGLTIKDAQGNVANVTIMNVMQSNGVIFVIDKVLMP
jgi:uncharacterized surface protein with fasciclin (FAS1) repeats